jgi:hypothetical protein
MRAIITKRIRRQVYGTGHHIGPVHYSKDRKGTVTADNQRQVYQRMKKQHRETS